MGRKLQKVVMTTAKVTPRLELNSVCIRAPPQRSKTVVLAKMQKLHHLKQISELNIPVGVIFNGNA